MKRPNSNNKSSIKAMVVAGILVVTVAAYVYANTIYIYENQQNQMHSPSREANVIDDTPIRNSADVSINSSYIEQKLKALPNLSLLSDEDLHTENRQDREPGLYLTAVPARSLFDYQANVASDTFLIQPAAVESLQEMFDEATNSNYPLRLVNGYVGIDDMKISNTVTGSEPPAGYNLRHTGYAMSLSCGNVAQQRFKSSICYSWLTRNDAAVAREYGLLPLSWLNSGSPYSYSDYDFLWIGAENLRDNQNVIE